SGPGTRSARLPTRARRRPRLAPCRGRQQPRSRRSHPHRHRRHASTPSCGVILVQRGMLAWVDAHPYDARTSGISARTVMIDGFLALYIFMLAAITGYEIIARVPVILHTPLMS